jgi:hypothetical protein
MLRIQHAQGMGSAYDFRMLISELSPLFEAFTRLQPKLAPLALSDEYAPRRDWNDKYPHADVPGVYLFADDEGRILYIGKSEEKMGRRLSAHLGSHADREAETMFPYAEWDAESAQAKAILDNHPKDRVDAAVRAVATAHIVIRTVHVSLPHWAPVLESYLIAAHQDSADSRPVFNRMG